MKRKIFFIVLAFLFYYTGNSQKLGFGTITPNAKLHIRGNANVSQLIIDANDVQHNIHPLIKMRNINEEDLIWIHSDHPTNTFIGLNTGRVNTVSGSAGTGNTFIGTDTGFSNTTGEKNTAGGYQAFYSNTTGNYNTCLGNYSLFANTSGSYNSAIGYGALFANVVNYNTACGSGALQNTTYGQYNVGVGYNAGYLYDNWWNNLFFGAEADVTAPGLYNVIAFGNIASCTAVSQARFGNSSTVTIGGAVGWTNISDGRLKKNIQENVPGLSFINKLRPVTYYLDVKGLSEHLNEGRGHELNEYVLKSIAEKEQMLQTGFLAQEVETAAHSVGYDFSGIDAPQNEKSLYGLRYAEFVVPLVKAVQELKQKLDHLKKENIELKNLEAQIAELKESFALFMASQNP